MDTLKGALVKLLDVPNLLGAVLLCAWLAMKFMNYDLAQDDTLKSVILIVVGFIWGSSAGSKAKDKPAPPSP